MEKVLTIQDLAKAGETPATKEEFMAFMLRCNEQEDRQEAEAKVVEPNQAFYKRRYTI